MQTEHQLNEKIRQLMIADDIESERTKQADYDLKIQRNVTLGKQLSYEESRIDLHSNALAIRKKQAQNSIIEQEILGLQDDVNYLSNSRQLRLKIQAESLRQQALEASEKHALNNQKLKELRACFGTAKYLNGGF